MRHTTKLHIVLALLILVLLMAGFHYFIYPSIVTKNRLATSLDKAMAIKPVPDRIELGTDYWGNTIVVRCQKTPTKLTYTALSKGPDNTIGTDDDQSLEIIDYNVSRIVGTWTGEKAGQFLKGVKEGLSKDSKFEDK